MKGSAFDAVAEARATRRENRKHNETAPGYRKRCVNVKKLAARARKRAKIAGALLLK